MKSHMDAPKEKLYCFINNCERFYFSLETLKKHLQKSHKKEYETLKEENKNKNFNQIYLIIKNANESINKLDFINFKDEKMNQAQLQNNDLNNTKINDLNSSIDEIDSSQENEKEEEQNNEFQMNTNINHKSFSQENFDRMPNNRTNEGNNVDYINSYIQNFKGN